MWASHRCKWSHTNECLVVNSLRASHISYRDIYYGLMFQCSAPRKEITAVIESDGSATMKNLHSANRSCCMFVWRNFGDDFATFWFRCCVTFIIVAQCHYSITWILNSIMRLHVCVFVHDLLAHLAVWHWLFRSCHCGHTYTDNICRSSFAYAKGKKWMHTIMVCLIDAGLRRHMI